jgi:hypothetical protein
MSFVSGGIKSRWAREIDVNDPEGMFGISNAQASVFSIIHGLAVEDNSGNHNLKVDAVATAAVFNLTDYANFGIGSTILHVGAVTPTLYVKVLSSAVPAFTDWWKAALTQAAINAVT